VVQNFVKRKMLNIVDLVFTFFSDPLNLSTPGTVRIILLP